MKKICSIVLSLSMILSLYCSSFVSYAINTKTKERTIHVVYDDSGSMAYNVTSWSQAKYALEVFAAMMGETDNLVIYPMSSFSYRDRSGEDASKSGTWQETVKMNGTENPASRVEKINKMNGDHGTYRNTPIQTVNAAGDDLKKQKADEKWLVVLTDGAFDEGRDNTNISNDKIRSTILSYAGDSGINVAYVAIGASAISLQGDKGTEFFYPYDADTNSILKTVTDVATTVFNYQPIPSLKGGEEKSFRTDIPISKVIIFAQGDNVEVDELELDDSDIEPVSSVQVGVPKDTKYIPKNYGDKTKVADGLKGEVITYESKDDKHPFRAGTFEFDCTTDNVQVYFEPGVDIQAILVDNAENEVNLSDDATTSIEAGTRTVSIQMVNPLTGDVISPNASELLTGAQLSMTVYAADGTSMTYRNGDAVTLPEGDIEITAKATFKGDIEKTSSRKTLKVAPAQLKISFLTESGYSIDPVTLATSSDVKFQIVKGNGTALTAEECHTMNIKVNETEGLKWVATPLDESGLYQLVPEYTGANGAADVDTSPQKLIVEAETNVDGIKQTGSASTQIAASIEQAVELVLTMELPNETFEKGDKNYMFDCQQRGIQDGAPYILVSAAVKGPDKKERPLTTDEWIKGSSSFSYESKAVDSNLLMKLAAWLCHQKLEFEIAPGEKTSTYQLYLSGLTAADVRPNLSELQVKMSIKLDNGILEEGSTSGQVSVRPAAFWLYFGRAILSLLLLAFLATIAIMELRKKRFDKDMYPNTFALMTKKNGIPEDPVPKRCDMTIYNRVFPPWKAEEMEVKLEDSTWMTEIIRFHCVATGYGMFRITDIQKFESIRNRVTIAGRTYDDFIKKPIDLKMSSKIRVDVKTRAYRGEVVMAFQKDRKSRKQKNNRNKRRR